MAATLATLTGWLLLVSLVLALGGVGARLFVLPRAVRAGAGPLDSAAVPQKSVAPPLPPPPAPTLAESAARVALAGAALGPFALGCVFVRQLVEFRDPFVPWQADARLLLLGTAWGDVWLVAACTSLVCAAGFVLAARGRRAGWWIGVPSALALGAFPALTGHASGGTVRWLTVPADVLHVWAAGFWVGGLAFVLYADRRARRADHRMSDRREPEAATPEALPGAPEPDGPEPDPVTPAPAAPHQPAGSEAGALPVLVPAFSPLAVASVSTLVLTGVLASWIHLPEPLSPLAILSAPYGRTLAVKLLLALVVFGLGATNWRRLTPRLPQAGGVRALRRTALVELGVAQLVLLVTALLVRTAP